MGSQRVRHNWVTFTLSLYWIYCYRLKILPYLKTKNILFLLASLFLPCWLEPSLASLASLSNNTAGLSGLRVQLWADSHSCQPARLGLALTVGDQASAVNTIISSPFQLESIMFSFPMVGSNFSSQFSPGEQCIISFSPLMGEVRNKYCY